MKVEKRIFDSAQATKVGTLSAPTWLTARIIKPAGVGSIVIGGNLVGVRIFGEGLRTHPAAKDHKSRNARASGWLQALIVGIAAGMRSTRRMSHQKDFSGIDADFAGMLSGPLDDTRDVLGRRRITRIPARR